MKREPELFAPTCDWCHRGIPATARVDARFCSRACRQAAFRLRRRRETTLTDATPARFAYADPPYPGTAFRYYGDQPTYAGEVDHKALLERLTTGGYAGWALSTSARALKSVLSLCPGETRVCAWVKPLEPNPKTNGIHNAWEPLLVFGGRQVPPGRRDWLLAAPARGGGEDLPGRKPLAFCAWLFDVLGLVVGDVLDDMFPGTGIVGRAWEELSRRTSTTGAVASGRRDTPAPDDSSPAAAVTRSTDDASRLEDVTGVAEYSGDASPAPGRTRRPEQLLRVAIAGGDTSSLEPATRREPLEERL